MVSKISIFPWFFNIDMSWSCISFWHCYKPQLILYSTSPTQLCMCWAIYLICPLSLHLQGLFRTKSVLKIFYTGNIRCKRILCEMQKIWTQPKITSTTIEKWTLENQAEKQKKRHYKSKCHYNYIQPKRNDSEVIQKWRMSCSFRVLDGQVKNTCHAFTRPCTTLTNLHALTWGTGTLASHCREHRVH